MRTDALIAWLRQLAESAQVLAIVRVGPVSGSVYALARMRVVHLPVLAHATGWPGLERLRKALEIAASSQTGASIRSSLDHPTFHLAMTLLRDDRSLTASAAPSIIAVAVLSNHSVPLGTAGGGVMAIGWLQKAKGVFGRPEAPPQPFELLCDCGATLSGFRTDAPQKPACPACGAVMFVLPVCPYPVPASVRRIWLGEEEPPPPPKKGAAASTKTVPTDAKPRREPVRPKDEAPPAVVEEGPTLAQRLRAAATPVRMVVLLIVAAVSFTGMMMVRSSRQEWARSHLRPAVELGVAALRDRDFPAASDAFAEASLALDHLGRRDATALAVRQMQREVEIARQLSSSSLTEVLEQVAADEKGAQLAERFRIHGEGEWFVFDVEVQPERSGGSGRVERCRVDVPLLMGEEPLDVEFDDAPWPQFWKANGGDGPRRMVFAAQLDRIDLSQRRATLVLRSSSAALWCHAETYQAVLLTPPGADVEPTVRQILQHQREFLGVGDVP